MSDDYKFALPVVSENHSMDFFQWKIDSELLKNRYGILEPNPDIEKKIIPDEKTLVLVPCLALDKAGTRLGMGGGYYDRFFERFPKLQALGICYPFEHVDNLPKEDHDIRLKTL